MIYLSILACLFGAILQFAVHRAPDIVDTRISVTAARKITIVALLVATAYMVFGQPSPVTGLILGLLGMGQMLYALHNLKLEDFKLDLHLGPDT